LKIAVTNISSLSSWKSLLIETYQELRQGKQLGEIKSNSLTQSKGISQNFLGGTL